ncbi:MAG: hypothetical protein HYU59_06755 [Magnetospirillum gryphiswaldense]|nr:hypothetical protein [Magnetospirillum gryphiswaldense]
MTGGFVPKRPYAVALIANQHMPVADMAACVRQAGGAALVLTSHALFPAERAVVSADGVDVDMICFNDLLDDARQVACDERASASLAPCLGQESLRDAYPHEFQRLSMRLKNQALHAALGPAVAAARLFHVSGLGVDDAYWRGQGSTALDVAPPPDAATMPAAEPMLTVVRAGGEAAVFLSGIGRLRLADGVRVDRVPYPDNLMAVADANPSRGRRLIWGAVAPLIGPGAAWRLATTIHGYTPWMHRLAPFIEVYVDGYHPPNYPRTYLDYYPDTAVMRSNDVLSARWFVHHGRTVRPTPLLVRPTMAPVDAALPPSGPVLVALNHAGDWSALINRADTDRLVLAAAELARGLPAMQVIVRPHPTMAMAAHEGGASFERLADFVTGQGLANLSLSRAPLDVDFDRGRLFVSEYSQVLIDALRRGRLGVAANLSGRRSLLADYRDLGLPHADSVAAMIDLVATIAADPDAALRQNAMAERVNALTQGFCS